VTASALAEGHRPVTYFEGMPIPSSIVVVLLLLVLALVHRTDSAITGGLVALGWLRFHVLALVFVLWGSLMVAFRLHIPKP
jgi:CDP-diacylglycerol--serine O-phosphatidyltransferase